MDHLEAIIDDSPMTSAYLANTSEGETARAAFSRMRMTEEDLRETAETLSRARQLLDPITQFSPTKERS